MSGSKDACTDEFLFAFGAQLAEYIAPHVPKHIVQQAINRTLEYAVAHGGLPAPIIPHPNQPQAPPQSGPAQHALAHPPSQPPPAGQPGRNLELVFVHDCRNHGCNVLHCVLCKHNPNKRCQGNFAHKYWVGDKLLAKCEGEIAVELIDSASGERLSDNLNNYRVELCILDGNKYNTRVREAGEQRVEILDECEVLRNQKGDPLLIAAAANNDSQQPRLTLKFNGSTFTVPMREVKVTESSESVLAGTKRPPFRLVVRAVYAADGRRAPIRPAVSEEFVVVTKRTKNLKKQDIPSLDDPISKLNHIGKETVKKLNELKASADEAALELPISVDLFRVTKVREFQKLARMSEADGHLQQKLKQLLKLSKEKWDAACDHAKTAVQVDNRMRAWYMPNMSLGLLYNCTLGDIRPDYPVALVANHNHDGADFMEVIPTENQVPAQREQVRTTVQQAVRCWWSDNHEGWMIFTLGGRHFQTLEEIIQYSQSEGAAVNGAPMPPKGQQQPPQGAPQRFDRRWDGAPAGASGPPQDMHAAQRGEGPPGSYAAVQHRGGGMMMGPPQGGWEREDPSAMQGYGGMQPRGEQYGHMPRGPPPPQQYAQYPPPNSSGPPGFNPFDAEATRPFHEGQHGAVQGGAAAAGGAPSTGPQQTEPQAANAAAAPLDQADKGGVPPPEEAAAKVQSTEHATAAPAGDTTVTEPAAKRARKSEDDSAPADSAAPASAPLAKEG
ncbi:hypothetical protein WJX73_009593 [Symbiochloris irregularis]|uniref:Uncharacterized protein n=1 Tax=Symbiochloris irregularis TaxID=706552 RepID=A0AAW1P197_9CHLO